MEPIISPWVFYWLSCFENITFLFGLFVVLLGCYLIFSVLVFSEVGETLKHTKTVFFVFGICAIIATFFPSKQTIIQMYCASQVTPNNIEKVVDVGTGVKNTLKKDLIEIIRAINEDTLQPKLIEK